MKFPFCGLSEEAYERAKKKAVAMMRLKQPNVHRDYRVFLDANGNYCDLSESVILFMPMPGEGPDDKNLCNRHVLHETDEHF